MVYGTTSSDVLGYDANAGRDPEISGDTSIHPIRVYCSHSSSGLQKGIVKPYVRKAGQHRNHLIEKKLSSNYTHIVNQARPLCHSHLVMSACYVAPLPSLDLLLPFHEASPGKSHAHSRVTRAFAFLERSARAVPFLGNVSVCRGIVTTHLLSDAIQHV
jgi:hypothetical protein